MSDYPEMPEGRVQVLRDGKAVSGVLPSADEAFVWLMRNQGQSAFYALTHGGYSIARTWGAQAAEQVAPVVDAFNNLVAEYMAPGTPVPAAASQDLGVGPLAYIHVGEDPSHGPWYAYVVTPLVGEAVGGEDYAGRYGIGYEDGKGGEHVLLPGSTPPEVLAGALLGAWLRGTAAYRTVFAGVAGEKITDPVDRSRAERAVMR